MTKNIDLMGQFTAIGMRTKVDMTLFQGQKVLIVNTCGANDTTEIGDLATWSWSNPTNRSIIHPYADIEAVSVECLWQGTKMKAGQEIPNPECLNGNWRLGKGKRPVGAYTGRGNPLITTPGGARRKIYIPAFRRLIEHGLQNPEVAATVQFAKDNYDLIFLRDFDTGRGIDRNGPMSHAFVLAMFLNTGSWDFAA